MTRRRKPIGAQGNDHGAVGQWTDAEPCAVRAVFQDDDGRYRDLRGEEVEDGTPIMISSKL